MDLKENLQAEIGQADWENLKFFADNNVLIFLNEEVDLLEAGLKVVNDDSLAIQKMILEKKILKMDIQTFQSYKDKKFNCLILEPFVLCQVK